MPHATAERVVVAWRNFYKIGVSKLFPIEDNLLTAWSKLHRKTVLFICFISSINRNRFWSNIKSSARVYAFVFIFFLFLFFIFFSFTPCLIKQWFVYLFIHSIHFVSQNFVINIQNESLSASFFHRTWFTADLGVKDAT